MAPYHISPSCSMPGTSVTLGRLDFISEIMEYDENVVKNLRMPRLLRGVSGLSWKPPWQKQRATDSRRFGYKRDRHSLKPQMRCSDSWRQTKLSISLHEENERLEAEKQRRLTGK